MAFTYQQLKNYQVPDFEQAITHDDCILYALSAGLGMQPEDPGQLRYLYEDNLTALPTMANVIGSPGFWIDDPATGVDWKQVLHGEQFFEIHSPLPTTAKVVGKTRVLGLRDRGEQGTFVYSRCEVFNTDSGELICTVDNTSLCRGDTGNNGQDPAPHKLPQVPDREPDEECVLPILAAAALLYRLNGDKNPLHADPEVARHAGLDRPILHGLCTLAHVGHALLKAACDYDGSRIKSMGLRFTSPVFPGEHLCTEIWHENDGLSFQATAVERKVLVIGHGRLELHGGV